MTGDILQKKYKAELARDFKSTITDIENNFRSLADGKNVIVGMIQFKQE